MFCRCGGLNENAPSPQAQSPVGEMLEKFRRCGLVGVVLLKGVGFEVSEAHTRPIAPHPIRSSGLR